MYSMMTANIGPRERMVFTRLTDTRAREAYLRISLMRKAAESGITALSWGFVSGLRWWSLRILVKMRPKRQEQANNHKVKIPSLTA